MEPDNIKLAWKRMSTGNASPDALKKMIRENRHPVLKGIRRQLVVETITWTVFLFVYYDFFDGHLRSLAANILLVVAVLLLLAHNVIGYISCKFLVVGNTLKQSLEIYVTKLKKYAWLSVATRVIAIIALMTFFISSVRDINLKLVVLANMFVIIAIQALLLTRVWRKRIKQLQQSINDLSQAVKI